MQRRESNNNSSFSTVRQEVLFYPCKKVASRWRRATRSRQRRRSFFFSTTFFSTGAKEGEKLWGNWWRDVARRWEGADLSPEIREKSRKEGRPTKVRVRWFRSLALLEKVSTSIDDYSNENGGARFPTTVFL